MAEVAEKPQDLGPRCASCNRLLAISLSRPWVLDCPKCGIRNMAS